MKIIDAIIVIKSALSPLSMSFVMFLSVFIYGSILSFIEVLFWEPDLGSGKRKAGCAGNG